jgi:type IV pilus assembly protein PilC
MGEYVYEGIKEGKKVKGKLSASSRSDALRRLRLEGITPVEIKPFSKRLILSRFRFDLKKPSEQDLSFVLLQIAVLLESGLTLAKSLELLSIQMDDQRLSGALLSVKSDIERGEGISASFRKTGLFPDFFCEMLTAAETGENLEKVFQIAGKHLETIGDMKSRILNAIVYPLIVIGFSLVALFIAIKFVVPKIATVLEGMGKDLPLITKAVLLLSDLFGFLLWIFPLIGVFLLLRRRWLSQQRLDSFLRKLPVVGKVRDYFDFSRFAYSMAITLESAVPITKAYEISVGSISGAVLREKLREKGEDLERGVSLSSILKETKMFPPLFINLVETGENSGELEKMLKLLAEVYKRESLRLINLWIRLIEPVSILLIGIVVGLIVISVLVPLTEVTTGAGIP